MLHITILVQNGRHMFKAESETVGNSVLTLSSEPLASVSVVLGSQVCATTPGVALLLKIGTQIHGHASLSPLQACMRTSGVGMRVRVGAP